MGDCVEGLNDVLDYPLCFANCYKCNLVDVLHQGCVYLLKVFSPNLDGDRKRKLGQTKSK